MVQIWYRFHLQTCSLRYLRTELPAGKLYTQILHILFQSLESCQRESSTSTYHKPKTPFQVNIPDASISFEKSLHVLLAGCWIQPSDEHAATTHGVTQHGCAVRKTGNYKQTKNGALRLPAVEVGEVDQREHGSEAAAIAHPLRCAAVPAPPSTAAV